MYQNLKKEKHKDKILKEVRIQIIKIKLMLFIHHKNKPNNTIIF